jgi:hypothetical protein
LDQSFDSVEVDVDVEDDAGTASLTLLSEDLSVSPLSDDFSEDCDRDWPDGERWSVA